MSTTTEAIAKAPVYENNPFFVAVNGLELLFKKAQAIGIVFAVLMALSAFGSLPSAFIPPADTPAMTEEQIAKEDQAFTDSIASVPVEIWILIAAVGVTLLIMLTVIGIVISGIADYTASRLAKGQEVSFSEAIRTVFVNFFGYTWVLIVTGVKVFLWSLLLIVPGIVMSVRYSLAGVVYFDKKAKGNGAVKESARLTKGAWLTTFASQSLFNILTFGLIELVLVPGTQGVLYRQLQAYDRANLEKPAAHVLSWLTLLIPILLLVTIVIITVTLMAIFSQV